MLVHFDGVDAGVHHVQPPLQRGHLKQREDRRPDVVEVEVVRVLPLRRQRHVLPAGGPRVVDGDGARLAELLGDVHHVAGVVVHGVQRADHRVEQLDGVNGLARVLVVAEVELAHEEVEPEDAEDEVEEEAHQHHVGDARDGLEERVHHHLHPLSATGDADGAEGAEGTERAQGGEVPPAHAHPPHDADEHDEEVQHVPHVAQVRRAPHHEAQHRHLHGKLNKEQHDKDLVENVEHLLQLALRPQLGGVDGQNDGAEADKHNDHRLEALVVDDHRHLLAEDVVRLQEAHRVALQDDALLAALLVPRVDALRQRLKVPPGGGLGEGGALVVLAPLLRALLPAVHALVHALQLHPGVARRLALRGAVHGARGRLLPRHLLVALVRLLRLRLHAVVHGLVDVLVLLVGAAAEVVQQDGQEEVEDDVVADDHQQHKVQAGPPVVHGVHSIVHHGVPILAGEDLEDGDERPPDVVEVVPRDVGLAELREILEAVVRSGGREVAVVVVNGVLHAEPDRAVLPGGPPAVLQRLLACALDVALPVVRTLLPCGAVWFCVLAVRAELQLVAKELHPQQGEDEAEEQQDEREVRDVHQRLEDGADDVIQLLP
mmetsp:Transcript_39375/g.85675  ORF Transcript_39375/g.85675 Transcript_39375/m.85675 type:complete len:602 (-) Transcript_39375:2189-3994(-)